MEEKGKNPLHAGCCCPAVIADIKNEAGELTQAQFTEARDKLVDHLRFRVM